MSSTYDKYHMAMDLSNLKDTLTSTRDLIKYGEVIGKYSIKGIRVDHVYQFLNLPTDQLDSLWYDMYTVFPKHTPNKSKKLELKINKIENYSR